MKKSQSSPSLRTLFPNINKFPLIKNSISTSSLPIQNQQTQIELVLLTNNSINKFISCSLDYNKFPEEILEFDNNLNYIECIETPSDPIPDKIDIMSNINKSYLELSIENSEQQEKYIRWISRIRRKKYNQ